MCGGERGSGEMKEGKVGQLAYTFTIIPCIVGMCTRV